ncbi:MAG: hypothetical protein JSR69_19305 [Proteobacteria bacterium]|nr:hypothetical protein [Pseudomonadota bacterium]
MAGFENYLQDTQDIEREIERRGVALGIDWNDAEQVRVLAREAIEHVPSDMQRAMTRPIDYQQLAKVELFGLAALMLRTMQESASIGFESHGGVIWKTFARALWAEAEGHRAQAPKAPGTGA